MKKFLTALTIVAVLLTISLPVSALTIDPSTMTQWTGNNTNNMSAADIAAIVEYNGTLNILYKQDVGAANDEGSFASSYNTDFQNSPSDPQDATITYTGGAYITGSPIYLYVKDGNHTPAWYIFDISNWNGTEIIELTGFWPNGGAISHVTIYGTLTQVPEPMSLLLLGLGLVGLAGFTRKLRK